MHDHLQLPSLFKLTAINFSQSISPILATVLDGEERTNRIWMASKFFSPFHEYSSFKSVVIFFTDECSDEGGMGRENSSNQDGDRR